jgi:hypothetical protein
VRRSGVSSITSGSIQILVDESGRRRRVLRWSGRAVSVALLLWLGLLALGALGLQPLGRLPVLGQPQPRSSPPALPARIEAAAERSAERARDRRGAATQNALGSRPGRLDTSRGRDTVPRQTRERPTGASGPPKVSSPSRPGTSGVPFERPGTTAPSVVAGTGTSTAGPPGSTGVRPGRGSAEHGLSTSSPGLTGSSPGQVKSDGAPASPPVGSDPGQSAEHPPQGRGQSMTVPTP